MLTLLIALAAFAADDPVLEALDTELGRTMVAWEGVEDAPYYLGYRIVDIQRATVSARYGALYGSNENHSRSLGVTARVGGPELDNTHEIRGDFGGRFDSSRFNYEQVPVDGDALAIRQVIWRQTDHAIQQARQRIIKVRTNIQVKVEEEDQSADFSVEEASQQVSDLAVMELDRPAWEALLVDVSKRVDDHAKVEQSEVQLSATVRNQYFVSSEGTRIRDALPHYRLSMWASTSADDGMDLTIYRWLDVHDLGKLPERDELEEWADSTVRDLVALRESPRGEPYTGPILLRGRAAGVFIHEVFGHRVEGHRQKSESEGQTFKEYVGEQLLPTSISIYDDPTIEHYEGFDLNGFYRFDEEGQPAARAVLVDKGVFEGFLMSRSPIEGFQNSNGHGRAMESRRPVARMANTIIETTDPKSEAQLRALMQKELRAQGKPFGLIVDELAGGFTLTGVFYPNSFNIRASTAWRVYADGRPDELIRGIDLVGTPLVALGNIVAAGEDPGVFNGFCGAESGSVPNSAVSPSLFIRQLELQRKEKNQNRGPLLPRPDEGGDT